MPKVGSTLTAGKSFGEIESVKAVSDLYAPVAGEVLEVNAAVAADVQILGEDPYDKGWLIKVRASDAKSDMASMLSYDDYEHKIADSAN